MTIRPLPRNTFREQVVAELRNAIINGTYAPGAPLVELELAEKFGVSRGPIREAMRQLIEEGLVVTVPYLGTRVMSLTLDGLEDLFSVRAEMEVFANRLIWPKRDPELLAELRARHAQLTRTLKDADMGAQLAAEIELHELAYAASGNKLLMSFWNVLKGQMQLYWATYHRAHGRTGPAPTIHDRYVDLMHGDDFAAVEAEIRAHLLQGCATMEDFLRYQHAVVGIS
ncbi:GntR family transcriptional regulator [Paracoccus shanxieyensis]|uniref:GntR family transcriptional regulator n=1 Tax=Paracoccus shanxieyensis TaxID=2675752 RepID=A0A6L6IW46_9RHOB|nr:GntR family transcriptional regulator [Paracoccus shanxieyensis]MTH64129.1 GntR family transcriptional regulator [Paracoccus shanxieyensis]MTH87273.1 GntR family transcriptional regulator [Paracoccus shanxieyensis]